MQQTTQVFDLLLGNINPVIPDGNSGPIIGNESDGQAFANLLLNLVGDSGDSEATESLLLIDEPNPAIMDIAPGVTISAESDPAVSNTPMSLDEPASRTATIVDRRARASIIESRIFRDVTNQAYITEEVPVSAQASKNPDISKNSQPVTENVERFNTKLLNELPQQNLLPRNTFNNLIYREAVDIEPGKYEVLNQTLENSSITITVKKQHSNDAPIRLSLPVELFESEIDINRVSRVVQRAGFDSGANRAWQLQTLFDKLNLKGFEVSRLVNPEGGLSEKTISESQPRLIDIKLVAQESNRMIPAFRPVNRTELKASRESARPGSIVEKPDAVSMFSAESNTRNSLAAQPLQESNNGLRASRLPGPMELPQQSKNTFSQVLETGSAIEANRLLSDPIAAENPLTDITADRQQTESRPVRFVLPENLKTLLQPNGNSVTIKIDPEHLGPAKLNLSMHNNMLKARILVDNVYVKSMVEASVDHLVEQLSKSGIKVDQIEVSLNGNAFRDDMTGRRSFRQASKSSRMHPRRIADHEPMTPISPTQFSAAQYVGAQGVNILA